MKLATDAGDVHGMEIEVATDLGDATQSAADALAADAGTGVPAHARGPRDAAPSPGGDAPLRLTVGVQ